MGMGKEYAKLLGAAISIKKGLEIYPPTQLQTFLHKLSLNPQRSITEEDLQILSRAIHSDYFLLGGLSWVKDLYLSESILYSIRDQRIVSRSREKSNSLLQLAEKEVASIFYNYTDKTMGETPDLCLDVALLIDISHSIRSEWRSVNNGVLDLSRSIFDIWNINSRVNIVPMSTDHSYDENLMYHTSLFKIKKGLSNLKPGGICSTQILEKALANTLNNSFWRDNSDKIIIVVMNSILQSGRFLERFALRARGRGIQIFTIGLGWMSHKSMEILERLSIIGKGLHFAASYHQRLFDTSARIIDIFMESGRLFHGRIHRNMWEDGLFESADAVKAGDVGMPKSYLSEILYDEAKYQINAYNMSGFYSILTGMNIIKTYQLENNVSVLLSKVGYHFLETEYKTPVKKTLGRVLLVDEKISFWVDVVNKGDMDFFERLVFLKHYFILGVSLQEKPGEPYGITFNPYHFVTNLSGEYIPDLIRINLKEIVQRSDYYMSNGLCYPPIWFIKVKAEQIIRNKPVNDIRDQG
ncbi:MAG: VWA domain-containing protein [Spirochaetota bacterium]|nr:VWA domain-containing protein [Spirochaetota bacterium]